jgi:hypothetical protein
VRYFQHDTNSKTNRKLRKVIRTHGPTGYAIWWAALEELYRSEASGFMIEADELWLENLAEILCISDHRTLIRVFDTFAEVNLISPQLWADHHLHVDAILDRGDEYIRKKSLNAERQSRFRAKAITQSEEEECVSNALRNAKSNDVTPSEIRDHIQNSDSEFINQIQRSEDLDRSCQTETISHFENSSENLAEDDPTTEDLDSVKGKPEINLKTGKPRKGRKSSGGALAAKSAANPETFEAWWKSYRQMCLMIDAEPGRKSEAVAEWLDKPEIYESQRFQDGDRAYAEYVGRRFQQKGEVYGISHGCRYLRSDKWADALDRAALSQQVGVNLSDPQSVKAAAKKAADDRMWEEVRANVQAMQSVEEPDYVEF